MIGRTVLVYLLAAFMVHLAMANMQAFTECKNEYKVTNEDLTSKDEASQGVKCFAECLLKKTGCMDEDGELSEEKIKTEGSKFAKTDEDKEKFQAAASTCLEEAKTAKGECEKGYQFAKCMRSRVKHDEGVE